jgi:hypothetical protein
LRRSDKNGVISGLTIERRFMPLNPLKGTSETTKEDQFFLATYTV